MTTPRFDTPWRLIAAEERGVIERILELSGEAMDAQPGQLDRCVVRSCTICGGACGGFEFDARTPVEVAPGNGPLGALWSAAEGWTLDLKLWIGDRRLQRMAVITLGLDDGADRLPRWPTAAELAQFR